MNRITLILILLLYCLKSWSCDCKNISPMDSLREISYHHSDLVFVGKLIESKRDSVSPFYPHYYSFQIKEVFKGAVMKDTIFGKSFTSCSHFPADTGQWIIYANIMDSGYIDISSCGASRSYLDPLCWNCPAAKPRAPRPYSSKKEIAEFEKDWEARKILARKELEEEIIILRNKN